MNSARRIFQSVLWVALVVHAACGRTSDPVYQFERGLAYFKEAKFAKAAGYFERALAQVPRNASVLNFLAVCQLHEGKTNEAVQNLRAAIQLDPSYPPAHYNLGVAQVQQGHYQEALGNLRRGIQSNPPPPQGRYYLGLAYMGISAWAQAEPELALYLQTKPHCPEALHALGVIRARRQDPASARSYFEKALAEQPDYAPALLDLAIVEHHSPGRKQLAIDHYAKYLETAPKSTQHDTIKQVVAQLQREIEQAPTPTLPVVTPPVATAKPVAPPPPPPSKPVAPPPPPPPVAEPVPVPVDPPKVAAIEPKPPSPPAPVPTPPAPKRRVPVATKAPTPGDRHAAISAYNDGVAAHQRGDLNAAMTAYGRAVQADPSFSSAYYNLAIAHQTAGQTEKAIDQYEWAILTNPAYAEARFNYALALQQLGYVDDAIREFETLLKANPRDITAHLSIATLYARNRATHDKARQHYQEYLRLTPDKNNVMARDIRRWLDQNR